MSPFGKYSDGALIQRFEDLQQSLTDAQEGEDNEELVQYFENRLAQCGSELLRRSLMDMNHRTRLFREHK